MSAGPPPSLPDFSGGGHGSGRPPRPRPEAPVPEPPRRRRGPIALAASCGGAFVLAIVLVVTLVVLRPHAHDQESPEASAASDSSASDSSSPEPEISTSPSASSDAPEQDPQDTAPVAQIDCPTGDPLQHPATYTDGRIHGGGISFAQRSDLGFGGPEEDARWSFANDVWGQYAPTSNPRWLASLVVGSVDAGGTGFTSAEQATDSLIMCKSSSSIWGTNGDTRERTDLSSKAAELDGHDGWVREVSFSEPTEGESAPPTMLVVGAWDMGDGTYAFYNGGYPADEAGFDGIGQDTLRTLRVDE